MRAYMYLERERERYQYMTVWTVGPTVTGCDTKISDCKCECFAKCWDTLRWVWGKLEIKQLRPHMYSSAPHKPLPAKTWLEPARLYNWSHSPGIYLQHKISSPIRSKEPLAGMVPAPLAAWRWRGDFKRETKQRFSEHISKIIITSMVQPTEKRLLEYFWSCSRHGGWDVVSLSFVTKLPGRDQDLTGSSTHTTELCLKVCLIGIWWNSNEPNMSLIIRLHKRCKSINDRSSNIYFIL